MERTVGPMSRFRLAVPPTACDAQPGIEALNAQEGHIVWFNTHPNEVRLRLSIPSPETIEQSPGTNPRRSAGAQVTRYI